MVNEPRTEWPALPYPLWAETCAALHLWTQIVGKYRLAHTPWVNHSWHATLYVTPRGLTTGPISDGNLPITLTFDLRAHALIGETPDRREQFALEAMKPLGLGHVALAQVDALVAKALQQGAARVDARGRGGTGESATARSRARTRSAAPRD